MAVRKQRISTFVLMLLSTFGAVAIRAQPVALREAQEHVRAAFDAQQAGDYTAYRSGIAAALQLRPNHPGLMYHAARAAALAGDAAEALRHLEQYAAMGLVAAIDTDEAFDGLRAEERFEAVERRMARAAEPVGASRRAFVLGDSMMVPEGIAFDPADRSFYIGGIHNRRISRVDSAGREVVFAGPDDVWSVLGLAVDPEQRVLWAVTSAMRQTRAVDPTRIGEAALLRFDLASGRLQQRIPAPSDTLAHVLGDLTVAPDGAVYVSDAAAGAVYVLRAGDEELRTVVPAGTLASPQGLCHTASGTLLLADYSLGLLQVDAVEGTVAPVAHPDTVALRGIDGLACNGDTVLAVQNGVRPQRVLRMRYQDGRVAAAEVIAANHPDYDEPTLGTVVDGWFYYVANSHWPRFAADGTLDASEGLSPPIILRVPIR